MTIPFEDPTVPFRSLGADSSKSRPAASTAARAAQDRWPLLKAMAPARQAPVPPMDDADKRNWERAAGEDYHVPRRTLSVPDVAASMARSLGRLGSPAPALQPRPVQAPPAMRSSPVPSALEREPALAPDAMPAPARTLSPPPVPEPVAVDTVSVLQARVPQASAPPARMLEEKTLAPRPANPAPKNKLGHFASAASAVAAAEALHSPSPQRDRSLNAVFSRLATQQAPAETPAAPPPRAPFLSRLGRK